MELGLQARNQQCVQAVGQREAQVEPLAAHAAERQQLVPAPRMIPATGHQTNGWLERSMQVCVPFVTPKHASAAARGGPSPAMRQK